MRYKLCSVIRLPSSKLFLFSTGPGEGGEGTIQGTILPTNVECLGILHACTCAIVVGYFKV